MKNIFVLGALCCAGFIHAQITLTPASNFLPGNTLVHGNTTTNLAPNVVQGNASAAAQSWNFTTTAHDYLDTTNFVNATSVPAWYSAPFPQCPIASYKDTDTTRYSFWHADANGVYGDGSGMRDQQFGVLFQLYQDPLMFMSWPMTYGTIAYDTAYVDYTWPMSAGSIDSIRQIMEAHYTIEADAWGTLTTSYGTYNVLRIKRTGHYMLENYTHDTLSGWSFPTVAVIDERLYEWWTDAAVGWPVARIHVDYSNDQPLDYYILTDVITTMDQTVDVANEINLFPNPADRILTVSGEMNSQWEIRDMDGRMVRSGVLRNRSEEIDISTLASGVYVMLVTNEEGETGSRKFVRW